MNIRFVIDRTKNPVEFIEVGCQMNMPNWIGVPVYAHENEEEEDEANEYLEDDMVFGVPSTQAKFNDHCMLSCSIHSPASGANKELFAITSSLSVYGQNLGFEYPTFLPPGYGWISTAMRCSKWDFEAGKFFSTKAGKNQVVKQCDDVAKMLREAMRLNITQNDDLIARLDQVFAPYVNVTWKRELDPVLFTL